MQGIWQKYKPTSEFGNIIRMLFPSELVGCLKRVFVRVLGRGVGLKTFLEEVSTLIASFNRMIRKALSKKRYSSYFT